MVEISVIIPTLKDRDEIECLAYLDRGEFDDYEVIVRGDYGAAAARNEGIRRASADKLVFLDDDSRPCEDYLSIAANVLDSEAVVAGRIVHPRDDLFGRHFTDHYSHGRSPTYVDTFISCNMALRKEVFETVGLFDENFVWGHEEKELADRVRQAYDIYYDPDLVVGHPYAESLPDFWRKRYRQETQASYYWHKQGISTFGQVVRTGYAVLRPANYIGETVPHTVAKTGAIVAATLGRLRGIVDGTAPEPDGAPPLNGSDNTSVSDRDHQTRPGRAGATETGLKT